MSAQLPPRADGLRAVPVPAPGTGGPVADEMTGQLGSAACDLAWDSGAGDMPLQKVRLPTAHAHILLTDPATGPSRRGAL